MVSVVAVLPDDDCDDVDAAVFDSDSVDPQVRFEGFSGIVEVIDADVPAGVEKTNPGAVEWFADEQLVEDIGVEPRYLRRVGARLRWHRQRRYRLLLITGLHHIINNIAWFLLGDFHGATGDIKRFFAGDPTAGSSD